ncbi:MAG: outer membrane protein A [Smithella sp. PtaU1.Bin162]|nr:MAG: outer membrane protein A [Smithella sp. PtaU1.Bin162]
MKKIFAWMICLLTLQNVSAAEIRPADIEYRYDNLAASGNSSHSFMIREQETKRIKPTGKVKAPLAVRLSQPEFAETRQEIQLAEAEYKTIAEEALKAKASPPVTTSPVATTTVATSAAPAEKADSNPSCKKNIVFFPLNGSRISNPEKDQIREFINCLKGKEVKVAGFTCKIGGKFYNDKLAKARAHNVAKYLRQEGVVVREIIGKGRQGYISSLDFINRRVEIEQI